MLLFVSVASACTYNNLYINKEEDNVEGKVFFKKFYTEIANKKFDHLDFVVSDSLKNWQGPSKLVKYINHKAGNYKSYIIVDRYIRAVIAMLNNLLLKTQVFYVNQDGNMNSFFFLRGKEASQMACAFARKSTNTLHDYDIIEEFKDLPIFPFEFDLVKLSNGKSGLN